MSNSAEDLFNLAPLSPDPSFRFLETEAPIDPKRRKAGDAREIEREMQRQMIVIEAIKNKARYSMQCAVDMYKFSGSLFNQTARTLMIINQGAQGQAHAEFSDAFTERLVKMAARHTYGILEIGARQIAKETHKLPIPEEESPLRRLGNLLHR